MSKRTFIDALSPESRERVLAAARDGASRLNLAATEAKRHEFREQLAKEGEEDKLLSQANAWLEWRGYWKRTRNNIDAGPPPSGWQMHLVWTERNPLVLDLVLLRRDGRYLEIELKTGKGRIAKHQGKLIEGEHARLARSLDEVKAIIDEWEEED